MIGEKFIRFQCFLIEKFLIETSKISFAEEKEEKKKEGEGIG